MKKFIVFTLVLIIGFTFSSCGDSSTGSDPKTDPPPSVEKPPAKVQIPKIETSISADHTDMYAQMVRGQVESFAIYGSLYATFLTSYDSNTWVKNGNVYTYSFNYGAQSWKYEITDNTTSVTVKFMVSGNWVGETSNVTLTNGVIYEATYSADGKTGMWKNYSFTSSTASYVNISSEWSISSSNITTSVLTLKDASDDPTPSVFTSHVKADKSGDAEWKVNGVKTWTSTWEVDGSGEIKFYDSNGTVTQTKTWTKNP